MSDLERIKVVAKSVADSLAFAAPELYLFHIQRLFDVIFEGDEANKPVVSSE